jgi:hypothetical protein
MVNPSSKWSMACENEDTNAEKGVVHSLFVDANEHSNSPGIKEIVNKIKCKPLTRYSSSTAGSLTSTADWNMSMQGWYPLPGMSLHI